MTSDFTVRAYRPPFGVTTTSTKTALEHSTPLLTFLECRWKTVKIIHIKERDDILMGHKALSCLSVGYLCFLRTKWRFRKCIWKKGFVVKESERASPSLPSVPRSDEICWKRHFDSSDALRIKGGRLFLFIFFCTREICWAKKTSSLVHFVLRPATSRRGNPRFLVQLQSHTHTQKKLRMLTLTEALTFSFQRRTKCLL